MTDMDKKRDELSALELGDHCYPFIRGWDACKLETEKTHVPLSEVNKLVEALKFYANTTNWDEIWLDSEDGNDDNSGDCSCRIDLSDVEIKKDKDGSIYYSTAGLTARQALEQFAKYGEKR